MKKLLLAVLLLPLALTANADPITREQARQRAEQFLLSLPADGMNVARRASAARLAPVQERAKLAPRRGFRVTNPDHELYYVFNRGEGEGYVIASGDDSVYPVLGYTSEGEFDYTQLPENLKYWLRWQTAQLEDIQENPITDSQRPLLTVTTHPAVATLCTSRWNQNSPYNDECPMYFTLGRSVTGCVATAMAQVLYYHRAKSVTEVQKDIPAYDTWTAHETFGKLHVEGIPAGSPIDWDNMIDNYGNGGNAKQKKAVAQLMHYCGVAVHMDYTSSSSGAQSGEVDDAFKNYFGYGSSVKYVSTGDPGGDSWDNTLYNEVAAGRPVYLSGSNEEAGHAFVCDGYDGNRCFHINWGWGGQSDGYFMLSKLNPDGKQGIGGSSGGYSNYPEAIIGVEPENYATRAMAISNAALKKLCVEHFDADGDGTFTYGEAAAVTDLGDAFAGQRFTSFPELYNFTGLTTLSEGAFEGCVALSTIKLPKHLKNIGARAFKGCTALKTFVLPEGITAIGDEAFDGCKTFTCDFPTTLQTIGAGAFRGCAALTTAELPIGIQSLGDAAFASCTKLSEVILRSIHPQDIQLGTGVFEGVDLSAATLSVRQGLKSTVADKAQWKDFGNIYEERDLARGQFVEPTTGKQYYIYNVGTGRYLTRGEAWGTQAVVAQTDEPMRFELRKSSSMPDGVYYLYSEDTGADNHILFRTSTDTNVGNGVRACFVDGPQSHVSSKTAWWALAAVEGESNVFTLQIPSGVSGYKAAQYLGVNPDHASNAASPTYGAYSDVAIDDFTQNCHWMFVEYDAQAAALYAAAVRLRGLLTTATKQHLDVTLEQAVYDNLQSSVDDIAKAQRRLRRKLGFILFESEQVRQAAISRGCDLDGDGEITPEEAALVESFETAFSKNAELTTLADLQYFTNLSYIAGNSFKDCTGLTTVSLPDCVTNIYYRAFMGCTSLTAITMPLRMEYLGDDAFNGCTGLREVTVHAINPADIELGSDVFAGVDLSEATLFVPKGSADAYREAPVWQEFGTIREVHSLGQAPYSEPTENEDIYVYNLGQHRYIAAGEAYGTQGVADFDGIVYQLRRTKSMPADTYYLYGTNASTKNILFRTDTDSKVGEGVKTCFVDGSVSAKAYWKVAPVEGLEGVYTLQVPENQSDYVEGEYLGLDLSHESKYTGYNYTYGLYYDIPYDGNERNCQWAFLRKADVEALQRNYSTIKTFAQLLQTARRQGIDVAAEQAVYDNLDATPAEIQQACSAVRRKLHYIEFADLTAKTISVNAWDENEDGELSYEEAAAVKEIGTTFRSANTITSMDELRYFTSLTALPDDAFRACSKLVSVYIPAGVTTVGKNAFAACTNLRYAAFLTPQMLPVGDSGITPRTLSLFVPADLVDAYQQSEDWNRATVSEYTGIPTIQADSIEREYGRANPKLTFTVTGAPINGTPELDVDADTSTPVGELIISLLPGSVTTPGLQCKEGVLTINPASVTVTAKSFQRNIGEPNPEFTVTYSGFRNREKAEDVLLHEAVIECDATADSPAGQYEIRVSGAQAQNYVFDYVPGILTIIDPVGVRGINTNTSATTLYDLNGRPVTSARRGVLIRNGKKVTVK